MNTETQRRLRWRCRRGTRELDALLERYLERDYERASVSECRAFERLLECENDQLIDWILVARDEPTDAELGAVIRRIRRDA